MLETLFVWGLIILPLSIAIVLIAYRARLFILAVAGIVLVLTLIWAALRLGIVSSHESPRLPEAPIVESISCAADAALHGCRPPWAQT